MVDRAHPLWLMEQSGSETAASVAGEMIIGEATASGSHLHTHTQRQMAREGKGKQGKHRDRLIAKAIRAAGKQAGKL